MGLYAISARLSAAMYGLVIMATPGAAQSETASPPADGEVTIAELVGAVISARTVFTQVMRRDGNQFSIRQQNDVRLEVKSDKIEGQIDTISYTPLGVRKGKSRKFSAVLEQPKEVKFLGAGHAVWFFDKSTLTNLRTYTGGAFKRQIAFARTADGYTCAAQDAYARQEASAPSRCDPPLTAPSSKSSAPNRSRRTAR